MTLWLVRHAVTLAPPGQCYGRLDIEADPAATLEAARIAHRAVPADALWSTSPARRCRQLAQALQALRPDAAATVDPRLQEMDFGHWEGLQWDAIGQAALERWTADFARHAPGGGESVTALLARVAPALAEVRSTGRSQAWITHAGVIRAVRLLARGVSEVRQARDWPAEPIAFGSVEAIDLD